MVSRLFLCAASFLLLGLAAEAQTPAGKIKCAADNGEPQPLAGAKTINGSPARKTAWPWFSALILEDEARNQFAFCGGSVIAPEWVLTAAHCLHFIDEDTLTGDPDELGSGRLKVVIGVDDLRAASPENTYEATAYRMHESYSAVYGRWLSDRNAAKSSNAIEPPAPAMSGGNDIALIKLSRPWTGPLAPLASPQDETFSDGLVAIAGFGTVEMYKSGADLLPRLHSYPLPGSRTLQAGCARLMQVRMPLVDRRKCLKRYKESQFTPVIGEDQLCSGYEEKNQDSCSGDSGGPMVAWTKSGALLQAGVVSWGALDCAGVPRSYGVYTRVAAYRGWIEGVTGALQTRAAIEGPKPEGFLRSALGDLNIDLPGAEGKVRIAIPGGARVKLGQIYRFEVRSDVAGRIILIDIDAAGKITQILPNKFTVSGARIRPGETILAPGAGWDFTGFRADEPVGKGTLVALVVPDDFAETTYGGEASEQLTKGFTPVQAPTNYLMNILQQVSERAARANKQGFAYQTLDYEIVR